MKNLATTLSTPIALVPCAAPAHGSAVPTARLRHESAPASWQVGTAGTGSAKRQAVMAGTAAPAGFAATAITALNDDVTGSPPRGAPV